MNRRLIAVALGLIVFAALAVRVWPVLRSPENFDMGLGPYGDTQYYHRVAFNLYSGRGFSSGGSPEAYGMGQSPPGLEFKPAVTRGPVYPLFLSAVYRLLSDPADMQAEATWRRVWDRARLAQCALDAALCVAVFLIVRLLVPSSQGAALAAAALHAFNSYNIFFTRALLTETVTAFVLVWALYFYLRALKLNSWGAWLSAGVGWGIVLLARFEFAPYTALLAWIAWRRRGTRRDVLRKVLVYLACIAVVLAPWAVRNSRVIGHVKLTPVSYLGYTLYGGSYQSHENWVDWGVFPPKIFRNDGERRRVEALSKEFQLALAAGSPGIIEVDREFRRLAIERIRRDPAGAVRNWLRAIPHLWFQHPIDWNYYPEPGGGLFLVLLVLAVAGFAAAEADGRALQFPVVLLFIYLTLFYLPLHVEPRYSVPVMPALSALAGIGLFSLRKIPYFPWRPQGKRI